MRLTDLISQLNEKGIYPYVEAGKLKTRSEQPITDPQVIALIKDNKDALIGFLQQDIKPSVSEPIPLLKDREEASQTSFAQQRLWFIDQLEGQSTQYNINIGVELSGDINRDAIQFALNSIVQRHEILRTTYVKRGDQLLQQVNPATEVQVKHVDLAHLDEQEQRKELLALSRNLAQTSFDLSRDIMLRCATVALSAKRIACLFTIHHIASDGWSRSILMREFSELYRAFVTKEEIALNDISVQYRDYAAWQRDKLQGKALQQQLGWWKEQLKGIPEIHQLPLNFPRPVQQKFSGGKYVHTLKRDDLDALCAKYSVTPFVLLHTLFAVWMARYSNESDIVVGTPISGRVHPEVEALVGFFVNTLVLRTQVDANLSFSQLLQQNKANVLDAFSHQQIPFDMLVEELQPSRSLAFSPLFQILFSYHQSSDNQAAASLPGVELSPIENEENTNQFDIEFNVSVHADDITMAWSYNRTLFTEESIARFSRSIGELLRSAAESPDTNVLQLSLLDDCDMPSVQNQNTVTRFDTEANAQLVHQFFEYQAQHNGNATAVTFEEQDFTYAEINEKANKVAHYLQSLEVEPGHHVGLCTRRSADMIVGLLGILKAGAAYVPFDWEAPEDRIITQLELADINVVLTQSELMMSLPFDDQDVLPLDYIDDLLSTFSGDNPDLQDLTPQHTAYVIFTSGSTGVPKGVAVSHGNVANYLQFAAQEYRIDTLEGAVVSVPLTFDAVVTTLLAPWVVGKPVVLLSDELQNYLSQLVEYCNQPKPWLFKLTPAHLELLAKENAKPSDAAHHFVVGGEALSQSLAAKFFQQRCPNATLFNEYGPTEATVGCSVYALTRDKLNKALSGVPIGKAIANTRIYVMNEKQQPVPMGVIGELVVAGAGVSKGYINSLESANSQAEQKFIKDIENSDELMYRTGDLVRYMSSDEQGSGDLEYVGRVDDQIKLRGFRIELAEIDAAINSSCQVSACSTQLRKDSNGNSAIVAYVVPEHDFLTTEQDETLLQGKKHTLISTVRDQVKSRLPDYMRPSAYVLLAALPLTNNGKIDSKALPQPEDDDYNKEAFVAPETELEQRLAEIWQSVLNIQQIGIDDNFFSLGGHSLLATQVVSEIAEQLQLTVQVRELFELNTIRSLAQALSSRIEEQQEVIQAVSRESDMPLSFAQRRLWLVDRIDGGSTQYHIDNLLRLEGDLSIEALQYAFNFLLARHEVLRTNYVSKDEQPYQSIQPVQPVPVQLVEIKAQDAAAQKAELDAAINAQRQVPFDLEKDLMMRATLYRLSSSDSANAPSHVLLLTVHHIAADGWSTSLLIDEFTECYQAHLEQREPTLAQQDIQYVDYANWQHEFIKSSECKEQVSYWKEHLAGIPVVHSLPLDYPRPPTQQFHGGKVSHTIEMTTLNQLHQLAREHNASLFMVLQTAFALLIGRWSNETDVVIGSPIAGRTHKQLESLVGFFINNLVLRTNLADNPGFAQLLDQNKQMILGAYEHQQVPFDMLVDEIKPERSLNHPPVFQVSFTLHNLNEAKSELSELTVSEYKNDKEVSRFDLELHITETDDGLAIRWLYATSLFEHQTIERFSQSFATLLNNIVAQPDTAVQSISILPQADDLKLQSLQGQYADIAEVCVHRLFEQHAAQQPDAIAVECEGESLTYQELNQAANQVAAYLIAVDTKPEQLIGLCVDRSVEALIGILGILKAGAAYLPIDPEYPQERIAEMLEDSNVELILTQQNVLEAQPILVEYETLPLDEEMRNVFLGQFSDENISDESVPLSPDNLGYCIYTSGSTGKPKGVLLNHKGMVNLAHNLQKFYGTSSASKVLGFASFSFDGATWEWIWALTSGATLFLCGQEQRESADKLSEFLLENSITHGAIPPALLAHVPYDKPYAMEVLIIAGEACEPKLAWRWAQKCRVCNSYGPSEGTVAATHKDVVSGELITLGEVLDNVEIKVVNQAGQIQPIGVAGELYLGGYGLSRGYLNRDELTAEKFFTEHDGKRFYRTGDWVKWLNNDELTFMGRIDDQVKIRGFRVELGEIENRLLNHPWVDKAIAIADNSDGIQRLATYVVVKDVPEEERNEVLLGKTWRAFLKKDLPDYMVPAAFVVVDELPLTANGKVDKAKLPKPDYQAQQEYVAPTSTDEAALTEVWQEVLRVDQIGINDNFFENGGDSILAMQVVTRAKERDIEISTKQLFEAQTIAELARVAKAAKDEADTQSQQRAPQQAVMGDIELLPIQHLFLSEETQDRQHYNQAVLLKVPEEFNETALHLIIEQIYQRHDALRLRFDLGNGNDDDNWTGAHQAFTPDMVAQSCVIEELHDDHDGEWITERCTYWQRAFDLSTGPLLRAVYFKSSEGVSRLFIVVHHIVVDGVSWRILLGDVQQAYNQWKQGKTIALAAKTSSYQQWTQAIAEYSQSPALLKERDYWVGQYQHDVAPLPLDKPDTGWGSIGSTATTLIELNKDETQQLLQSCNKVYRTKINELLLAGIFLGMRRWTGSNGLRIRLEGHGREPLFEQLDTTETVGWFTSVYPLTLHSDFDDVGDVIKSIKEQYRALPNNGIGYGILRYLTRDEALLKVCEGHEPELEFNYLGQFDQVLNEDTAFDVADEHVGEKISKARQRMHRLGLSGKVFDGQLYFVLDYSQDNYNQETMQDLAKWMEDGIRAVINHCQETQVGGYTPSDFPLANVSQQQLDECQAQYPNIERLYPVTPMQAGLLFESMVNPETYVVQTFPLLRGNLNIEVFKQAWEEMIAAHDILRTLFVGEGESLHQLVVKDAALPWRFEDWRTLSSDEQQQKFTALRRKDRAQGFDFTQAPLLRITLIQFADDLFQLLWSQHHCISDGWSIPIVYRDVIDLYNQLQKGAVTNPLNPVHYQDYMDWLLSQDVEVAREYWQSLMSDVTSPTLLPLEQAKPVESQVYLKESMWLTEVETKQLNDLAKSHKTTVNTLVQWAWAYALHKYSGEARVLFGATISGRPAAVKGIEGMVGLFINTIPVKVDFAAGNTSTDSLPEAFAQLHRQFQDSVEYGYVPLSDTQRMASIPAGSALFDTLLVFENFPIDGQVNESDTETQEQIAIETSNGEQQTHYKMTLIVNPNDELRVEFRYRNTDFASSAVVRLTQQFSQLLRNIAQGLPLDLLTQSDESDIQRWIGQTVDYARELTISQGFERWAAEKPGHLALVVGDRSLTYAELNQKANQVAHTLREKGVKPHSWVGLYCDRSIEMVVGILAIVKAGAGYVPLDATYPKNRLIHIQQETQIDTVLTQHALAADLPFDGVEALCLDDDALFAHMPTDNIDLDALGVDGSSKLVALYTSGSTGKPKGVEHPHRTFVNFIECMKREYPVLNSSNATLHYSTINFDMSLYELTEAFFTGSTLVVVQDNDRYELAKIAQLIDVHHVDRVYLPTALLGRLAHYSLSNGVALPSLKVVQVAGERLVISDEIRRFCAAKERQLLNLYGPTESYVVSHEALNGDPVHWPNVPAIGRATDNVQLYVLDEQHHFVPVGVQGELYVAGDGLANGYIDESGIAEARFITVTLQDGSSHRVYKTGDLVRWNNAGSLEFIRRIDNQVKIRGFRIEIGEVEASIKKLADVEEVAVVTKAQGNEHYLVAYVVFAADSSGSVDVVKLALKQELPNYMMPSAFMVVDRLPLNANGKVDVPALPEPDFAAQNQFVAPSTYIEKRLAELWCSVLQLSEISVTASFFELGGHSILAMKLIPMVLSEFDVAVTVADLFHYPTIAEQASLISLLNEQSSQQSGVVDNQSESSEDIEELEW